MTLIDSLKTSYGCFDFNFQIGSIVDSISGNAGVINPPVSWNRIGKQRGLYFNNAGAITYPDTAANRLAGGQLTIIGYGNLTKPIASNNPRIISKRTSGAGNNEYDFFLTSTTMSFFVNATTSALTTTLSNYNKFYAVTLVNGAVPKFYLDGSFVGNGNNALTTVASNKSVIVGNFYGLDPTTAANGTISRVLGFSKVLTPEEIARVYEELLTTSIVGSSKSYNFSNTYIKTKTTPKLHWLLDSPKNGSLVATDLSGNGYHGTINQVGYDQGIVADTVAKFQGNVNSYVLLNNGLTSTIASNNSYTVSTWFKAVNAGAEQMIFCNNTASEYLEIVTTGIRWVSNNSGNNVTISLKSNVWYQVVAMKTSSTTGNIYINGEFLGTISNLNSTTATPGNLFLGIYPGSSLNLKGNLQDFRIYDQNLTQDEISDLYLEGAKKLNFYAPMKSETVSSLGYITNLGSIEGTPFRVDSNLFNPVSPKIKIAEYKNRKWLHYDGTGINYSQLQPIRASSNQVFGTWIFRCKPPVNSGSAFMFIGNKGLYRTATGATGSTDGNYTIYIDGVTPRIVLLKYGPSPTETQTILNILPFTNSDAEPSSIAITRNYLGSFSVYTKIGSSGWILPTASSGTNPIVDSTYTISKEISISLGSQTGTCYYSDFRFHEGALSLSQIQRLYPSG